MFEIERFIKDCQEALDETDPQDAVRQLLKRVVSSPAEIVEALGEPTRGEVMVLHRAPNLVVLKVVWGPRMVFPPHDHRMWATIGIYGGREDNSFYQRSGNGLTRHGLKEVRERDVIALGEDVIHSVTNPLDQLTAAIHVYGGNFFETPRSEWTPDSFDEHPYDFENTKRAFEASNARLQSMQTGSS